jgi:hypothetical protein
MSPGAFRRLVSARVPVGTRGLAEAHSESSVPLSSGRILSLTITVSAHDFNPWSELLSGPKVQPDRGEILIPDP